MSDSRTSFSLDGEWLGFAIASELRRVPVSGQGTVQTVHRFDAAVSIAGAAWTLDDTIVFGVERIGLLEVPAGGGETVPLTAPDPDRGEVHHGFPFVLPDGDILFTVSGGTGGSASRPA